MKKVYTKWYHYIFAFIVLGATFIFCTTIGKILFADWKVFLCTNIVEISGYIIYRQIKEMIKDMDGDEICK